MQEKYNADHAVNPLEQDKEFQILSDNSGKTGHRSVTFKVHKKSVEIIIQRGKLVPGKAAFCVRGKVRGFSYEAERRMRMILEDTIDLWEVLAVLTYPGQFPFDGRKVKRDVHVLIMWLKRQGVSDIFWGLEFQKRGAPHINFLLSSRVDKEKLSKKWFEIVGSGDARHLVSGTTIESIKNKERLPTYVVGYTYKRDQKDVPENFENVGRFWGCTRKSTENATYTYRYKDERALLEAMRPVAEFYQAKMDEWSRGKEKPYTWRFRGNSFVCWNSAEQIEKMIEQGVFNDQRRVLFGRPANVLEVQKRNEGLHVERSL